MVIVNVVRENGQHPAQPHLTTSCFLAAAIAFNLASFSTSGGMFAMGGLCSVGDFCATTIGKLCSIAGNPLGARRLHLVERPERVHRHHTPSVLRAVRQATEERVEVTERVGLDQHGNTPL